jgi:hypothetical protein
MRIKIIAKQNATKSSSFIVVLHRIQPSSSKDAEITSCCTRIWMHLINLQGKLSISESTIKSSQPVKPGIQRQKKNGQVPDGNLNFWVFGAVQVRIIRSREIPYPGFQNQKSRDKSLVLLPLGIQLVLGSISTTELVSFPAIAPRSHRHYNAITPLNSRSRRDREFLAAAIAAFATPSSGLGQESSRELFDYLDHFHPTAPVPQFCVFSSLFR